MKIARRGGRRGERSIKRKIAETVGGGELESERDRERERERGGGGGGVHYVGVKDLRVL